MLRTYDIITVGGATEDLFFTVDDYVMIDNRQDLLRKKLLAFEYGAKIGVPDVYSACGGGASNTAVACAQAGLKTAIITAVGNDSRGAAIIRNLKSRKIDTKFVEVIKGACSGLSFILVSPKHDHIVFTHRGANERISINPSVRRALSKAGMTYLTSLSGGWRSVLKDVFAASRSIAWNPGRQQLAAGFTSLRPFLAKTDILICNKDEAIELVMSHPNIGSDNRSSLDSVKYLLSTLRGFGPKLVVITNGSRGADAFDGTSFYVQKAARARRVTDTTGVGDAFGGAFVAGLLHNNRDIKKALALGAKVSAAVIAKRGAQH